MAHGSHGGGHHGIGALALVSALPGWQLLLLCFVLVAICGG